jgi:hypothetical protein
LNETVLEVIPLKSRIAYIETLKTDLNRMIYDCGGVLVLWFGISPIKAVDLLSEEHKLDVSCSRASTSGCWVEK